MDLEQEKDKVEHNDQGLGEETSRDVDQHGRKGLEPRGRLRLTSSRVRDQIEDPAGHVAAAPDAESFHQPLRSLDQAGQLGLQVDEVAVDDDGQPEDHHCHEQGQQRPGEPRVNPPGGRG